MRIVRFEGLLPNLLQSLDDPHRPELDLSDFSLQVSTSVQEAVSAGYETALVLHGSGEAKDKLPQVVQAVHGTSDITIWDESPEQILAAVGSARQVSCLGPGFFPLLGATLPRMNQALKALRPEPTFHLRWNSGEIESAFLPRLRISDALCRAGALLGAPQVKLGEMARYRQTPMSHKIIERDSLYSDGVEESEDKRAVVRFVAPQILPQKILFQVDAGWVEERPILEKRMFAYENGKEVETLIAWLPDLRDALLRSVDLEKLNRLHTELLECQNREIMQMQGGLRPECWELINPEGTIISEGLPLLGEGNRKVARSLTLGMVLTGYDSDMLLGRLLGKHVKTACRKHQEAWHHLILSVLRERLNRERILRMTGLKVSEEVENAYDSYFSHVQRTGSRVIRFVIEQAAVNFSEGLLRCARKFGLGGQNWPEPEFVHQALPQLEKDLLSYWPVVGIRVDYLLRLAGSQVKKRAIPKFRKASEQRDADREYAQDLDPYDEEYPDLRTFRARFSQWRPDGAD